MAETATAVHALFERIIEGPADQLRQAHKTKESSP
jgi:hypothetical protein